ncbi:helix-turn-helix domain-containing protein [Kribbella sp. NBC_01505]|uniref:ATP-binding protein n=1 Tax=Kribbella sp. NBC_01505 TaxID=2903580 RepID=UPI003868B32E
MAAGEFGDLLRHFRQRAGLTQEELADRSGVSVDAIGLLERGERQRPQRRTLAILADALTLGPADRERFEEARRGSRLVQAAETLRVPIPAGALLGRDAELAEATELLADPATRLLTLTGPGGVGKTRLAIAIAAELADVVFVPLADLRTPEAVAPQMLRSLGLKEHPGTPPAERLATALRATGTVLLVDNFEHLPEAAALVADLLATCPDLRVLATSRTALQVGAERLLAVRPFVIPGSLPTDAVDLPALRIFARRASSAVPGFVLTPDQIDPVAAICRRVDGLPLAIELAAPWLRVLTPAQLLAQLSDLELLAGGARDLPERHRTLRDTLEWSSRLLTERQREILAGLSVFTGGFTTEAALAVTGAGLPDFVALIDGSLVTPEPERFRLLETVRQYATEQLEPAGHARFAALHAAYFLEFAGRAELVGPAENAWKQRLAADDANLRAAVQYTLASGDTARSIEFARYLWRYWGWTGQITEADGWLAQVRALLDATVEPLVRAEVLLWSATVARLLGHFDQSEQLCHECLALEPETGHAPTLVAAEHNLGILCYELGRYDEAAAYYRSTVGNARRTSSGYGLPFGLVSLGDAEWRLGHAENARSSYLESLEGFRRIDHDRGIAQALLGLGRLAADSADLDEAHDKIAEAIRLTAGQRDPLTADCLEALAAYYDAVGAAEPAAEAATAARILRDEIGAVSS